MNRKATILRTTKETDITVEIALDGTGLVHSNCGVPSSPP
jgi:Imidazoleglycerol-phosphate dehydratase